MRSSNFQPQHSAHQWTRQLDEQVVELVFVLAAQLDRVAKPARGDEPGFGAFAFDEGIGEKRRGVHDPLHGRAAQSGLLE